MVLGQLGLRAEAAAAGRPSRTRLPGRLTLLGAGTLLLALPAWLGASGVGGGSGVAALITFGAILAGSALLLRAALAPSEGLPRPTPVRKLLRGVVWSLLALSCLATAALVAGTLTSRSAAPYNSDAAAFNQFNAQLALHGVNPYTADGRFWDAVAQFPDVGATPLRAGRYANSVYGPSLDQVVRDVRDELAHPDLRGPEYSGASLHSYPALSFLVYAPGLALGMTTTVPASLAIIIGFLVACGWGAARGLRPAIVLLLLANALLISGTLRGSFEVVALLPLVLAWRTLDRRWTSAILLGLGCAVKQIVWPLSALYVVIVWRRDGAREAVTRAGIAAGAFLLPNLPFLLASPGAWLRSLALPMTLPIFPSGVGLVGLSRAGLLPLFPSAVYAGLELAAVLAILHWFARAKRPPRPEVALLVGLLPFLLAWHSLLAYVIALPALAVFACIEPLNADLAAEEQAGNSAPRVTPI